MGASRCSRLPKTRPSSISRFGMCPVRRSTNAAAAVSSASPRKTRSVAVIAVLPSQSREGASAGPTQEDESREARRHTGSASWNSGYRAGLIVDLGCDVLTERGVGRDTDDCDEADQDDVLHEGGSAGVS